MSTDFWLGMLFGIWGTLFVLNTSREFLYRNGWGKPGRKT